MMTNSGEVGVKTFMSEPADAGQVTYRKSETATSPLAGFETRYAEAQRKAAEAKAKRKVKPRSVRNIDPDNSRFIEEAQTLKRLVRERLRDGFELPFDQHIAGRWRKAFREEGLRSEDNPILQLFVTLVPKGGRARASNDKATLGVQSRSKLLTLDYAYVELNKQFLGALRVDCDGVFPSPAHLLCALEDLVSDGRIPCLPHIIVGDLLDDGSYRRPHFIFLLPPGSAVWKSEDKRCRGDIVRLFVGVYNGLVKALLDIGADPAAPALTMRMKNPLSPLWHTLTPNRHRMPTLSEYGDWLDTRTNRETLVRHAAAIQSRLGVTPSNRLFNTLRERAVALLSEWHFAADARRTGSRPALADRLHVALEEHARETGLDDRQVTYVVAKVADYLAMNFDAAKLQGRKSRGRILDVVEGMKSVRQRQQAGAGYANSVRKDRSLEKLLAAYRAMQERGESLSPERLSSRAGVSRSTAYRHFAACQQNCPIGCIDKKENFTSCDAEQNDGSNTYAPMGREDLESGRVVGLESGNIGVGLRLIETEDSDLREIKEHEIWIASQERPETVTGAPEDLSDDPDIDTGVFMSQADMQTAFSGEAECRSGGDRSRFPLVAAHC